MQDRPNATPLATAREAVQIGVSEARQRAHELTQEAQRVASRAAALARESSEQVAELVRSGQASEVAQRVIREGTVRRIVVRRGGRPVVVLPLAAGLVALLFAPVLTAVGVLVALFTDCAIQLEREESGPTDDAAPNR
ncbi:MAG: hypothetical protein KatS3mg061_2364 [Dehalococcoidia bacterium]|nr:MAG: hypothetical protein KatS3mg061_2364 [Dehalococcoidia bacterium]